VLIQEKTLPAISEALDGVSEVVYAERLRAKGLIGVAAEGLASTAIIRVM
jgi:hypothetical protein